MKVGRWSTTAGNNNATPPDGWPEGQAASTVNDCARELMAAMRTVFQDAQFFDQDFTPTYVNATTFTVTGDQTSAIHAGRRLKLFDASVLYASVVTASFTAVTTIQIAADAGNLTTSLSSFAIAILSNKGVPAQLATISAAAVLAPATSKAWVRFTGTAGGTSATMNASFNVSSVSRSGTGTYRVNFTTPMADANYGVTGLCPSNTVNLNYIAALSATTTAYKFNTVQLSTISPTFATIADNTSVNGFNLVFNR